MSGSRYRFGGFELDTGRFQLRRGPEVVHLEPRVLDLLTHLVVHSDRVVTRNELLDSVWGDRFVGEAAITSSVQAARRALGDDGTEQRLIRTVPRRGYRLVAPVEVVRDSLRSPGGEVDADRAVGGSSDGGDLAGGVPSSTGAGPLGSRQVIRFCHADDATRIAYATVGDGPPLLKAANWMTHLDLEWQSPVWSHWLRGLARRRQLVRYDERGCGLSDWDVAEFSFGAWVDDLDTVVEAVGLDRFPLLGVSQGGAVAIAYAVRRPERVSHLILAGAYARGRRVRAGTDEERAAADLDLELARVGWLRQDRSFLQVFASQFLPDGTPEQWADFIEFQRRTASPENGVRFLEVFANIDVTAVAGSVRCPTLILHSRDDVRVPVAQAYELAALIPDSQLVLLDSGNHLLVEDEPAWPEFLDHVDAFLR